MKKILLFCILTACVAGANAQRSDRSFVRKGNRMFQDSLFIKAEENYLKAVDMNLPVHRLDALAEISGLSLSHFKEKFRRQMLTTPRAYINQQKIELAKKLLLETCNVTSVAEELGFDTPAYFSAVFRKFMAVTPSQYIRENIDRQ